MNTSIDKAVIESAVYAACLKSALELGPDLKGLSWFAKNARRGTARTAA